VADLSLNCSKASADGGDLPFYMKALVDCVEAPVQVDRVAVYPLDRCSLATFSVAGFIDQ
jgi:hypothetical protein